MPSFGALLDRFADSIHSRPTFAPDSLPFPPARLIHLVAGTPEIGWYWHGGQLGARTITELLGRRNAELQDCRRVLDFGCGCGRVIRHLAPQAPDSAFDGTDYNPALIRWCHRSLPLARFARNHLAPPTPYADATFDLVYAFSVFTHLTERLQHAWLAELRRITRPGGWIVITTHGDRYLDRFGQDDRSRYRRGEIVVWSGESEGRNRCATFHPPVWVRETLAPAAALEVLEFVPEGARGNPHQDAWLLRRPA